MPRHLCHDNLRNATRFYAPRHYSTLPHCDTIQLPQCHYTKVYSTVLTYYCTILHCTNYSMPLYHSTLAHCRTCHDSTPLYAPHCMPHLHHSSVCNSITTLYNTPLHLTLHVTRHCTVPYATPQHSDRPIHYTPLYAIPI